MRRLALAAALLAAPPSPCPPHLAGLVGAYGQASLPLYVFEDQGRLRISSAGSRSGPLDEPSSDVFRAPASGFRAGETLTFSRDLDGHAGAVRIGSAVLPRLALGVEDGTFHVTPLRPLDDLTREAKAATPPPEPGSFAPSDLVDLVALDQSLRLDIRYATEANFLGRPVYAEPRALMQRPAALAVVRAHRALAAHGLGLLIHDAYRPWFVTKVFWEATPPDKREFVADPAKGSRHNRGCAVDLTLFDRGTGKPIAMPSVYDEMSERAHPDFPGGTSLERYHRDLLRAAMEREGFKVFDVEWWHFDYKDWKKYRVENVTFDRIPRAAP
jgi:D-alanyl-D-alanine dipeptidase